MLLHCPFPPMYHHTKGDDDIEGKYPMAEIDFTSGFEDYINVREHLSKIGCIEPKGFAVIPSNLESVESPSQFLIPSDAMTIRKLLRQEDLPFDDIVPDCMRPRYYSHKSIDPLLPILFVSAALLSENPHLVQVALSVIGNYATEFFRGTRRQRNVKMEVVIEKDGGDCRKFSYEGPPENLKDASDIVKELQNG